MHHQDLQFISFRHGGGQLPCLLPGDIRIFSHNKRHKVVFKQLIYTTYNCQEPKTHTDVIGNHCPEDPYERAGTERCYHASQMYIFLESSFHIEAFLAYDQRPSDQKGAHCDQKHGNNKDSDHFSFISLHVTAIPCQNTQHIPVILSKIDSQLSNLGSQKVRRIFNDGQRCDIVANRLHLTIILRSEFKQSVKGSYIVGG